MADHCCSSGNGGHSHDGDHSHSSPETGISYSLYQKIDFEHLQCLNEAVENSGKTIFKAWEDRLSTDKFVESDADEELLFNIPFTDQIKLKGFKLIGGENGLHPDKIRLFKNRPHMTFDDVDSKADQEFELHPDSDGSIEYPTKIVAFSSVTHLSLHIPSNVGRGEITKLYYIGFKGEFSKIHRHGVTLTNYETTPQLSDHKNKLFDSASKSVM